MINWKSRDAVAGLVFLALAVYVGVSTLLTLDTGSLSEMGSGFFPLALSVILGVIGVLVLVFASEEESDLPQVNWRAVGLLSGAPIAFGLTVRSLGLLPALVISVAMATAASDKIRPVQAALIVLGVTVFCVVVFKFGAGVPYDLINRRLLH